MSRLPSISDVTAGEWEALASRRIYFGHQSVGRNIMEGVREIVAAHPEVGLRVVQTDDPATVAGPAFMEGKVGANRDPAAKTADFSKVVSRGLGDGAIAFHKYCYVDVASDTDVQNLFDRYVASMRELAGRTPGVTLVHVTLPLTTHGDGVKELVKTGLGRPTELALNIRRNRYNELMREAFSGREPLFDLAMLECTGADGALSHTRYRSRNVQRLAPEWTYDNGHLNEAGRRYVAEQLLVMLAKLPLASAHHRAFAADSQSVSAQSI